MSITLELCSDKDFYHFIQKTNLSYSFLQSVSYKKFREKIGETIFLYGFKERGVVRGVVLIQKIKTRFKTFLHIPHGPIMPEKEDYWALFLKFYKDLGRQERCDFVRLSPLVKADSHIVLNLLKTEKFLEAPVHMVNPENTLELDLTLSEDEILTQMKKQTRYEVRRISKFNIKVQQGNTAKDLNTFWDLHKKTFKRQKFIPFPKKNTEIEIEAFGEAIQIFSASLDDVFYSSSIIIFDAQSAYYHQGASIRHKAPISHATLWEAIKYAKKKKLKIFNFWGVISDDKKNHPWYGLSKFKKGFGGTTISYLHARDYPLTKKYFLNFFLEKYRKWKRNY